jgi:hypothetical protein
MKKQFLILGILLCCRSLSFGQFGADVIIANAPAINQRQVEITSAFNGWLYAAYTTVDSAANEGGVDIKRSIDRGMTWQHIDSYSISNFRYEDVDLVVAGTDTNNLTLFVAGINHNLGTGTYVAYIDKYNGTSLSFIGASLNKNTGTRKIYDVELASDYQFPAVGASPYSVALLVTEYSSSYDSITVDVSVDGGNTFAFHEVVATTGSYFRKASISYGRSSSGSNGRYFAVWEQLSSTNARTGHIYTGRSSSTVDGPWITPVCLDSISATMINLCRNPRIATSFGTSDNDSGSVTAVVLVERDYTGDGTDYDMLGFANERSHFTNFWYRFDVINNNEKDMQADVIFDTDSNKFRATYYDSTNAKLTYINNDWNLANPNTWTIGTYQYNDVAPGTNPYPRLAYSPAEKGTAAVWTRKGTGTNGVAMFDASYTAIYVGIDANNEPVLNISAYPNPTTNYLYINLDGIDMANLILMDNNGRVMETYNAVTNNQMISLETLPTGIYFLQFTHNGKSVTKKIIKN